MKNMEVEIHGVKKALAQVVELVDAEKFAEANEMLLWGAFKQAVNDLDRAINDRYQEQSLKAFGEWAKAQKEKV